MTGPILIVFHDAQHSCTLLLVFDFEWGRVHAYSAAGD